MSETEKNSPAPMAGSGDGEDFARLVIDTPFDAAWLRDFLSDPERVLRINPLMEFSTFERTGERSWRMAGRNLANERDFDVSFLAEPRGDGMRLVYDGWLKTATEFGIEPGEGEGFRLVITDDYSGVSEAEREQRLDEVDTSFMQWGYAIHKYLGNWKRWSWLPGWKLYMQRFWQRMKPSARRVSFMVIVVTAMEFVLFLFVFAIFWLELPRLLG